MDQLKLITQNGQILADSREVANMTGKRHDHLIRDIEGYVSILGQSPNLGSDEFFIESHYKSGTGKMYKCFLLTKIGCDMVANKMTGQKGVLFTAAYTRKFQEMERTLQEQALPSYMIDDPIKRAEKWINERKEYESVKEQQRIDQPYTSFGKIVSNSNGAISVGAFAKMMYDKHGVSIGRNKLFEWLRDKGYLIKSGRERNNPKQQYLEQGLFEVKATIVSRTEGDVETLTTLITGKGQIKLAELLVNEFKAVI